MPSTPSHLPRLGLCCIFRQEPIRFRTTTARVLSTLPRPEQRRKLSALCLENARALLTALEACRRLGIGAFRIVSTFFPRITHPQVGYRLQDLPDAAAIRELLAAAAAYRDRHDLRLSFHPDQFIVLSSVDSGVTARSLAELEYQGELAEMVGAEAITLHAGGAAGGKEAALARFRTHFAQASLRVRSRLALENDDKTYTVRDLLPVCERLDIPLVYDVHHHRCHPDGLGVAEATRLSAATWRNREPWLHISSPAGGWSAADPRSHAEYIDPADFPAPWRGMRATVDVEGKAKELAVLQLRRDLNAVGQREPAE